MSLLAVRTNQTKKKKSIDEDKNAFENNEYPNQRIFFLTSKDTFDYFDMLVDAILNKLSLAVIYDTEHKDDIDIDFIKKANVSILAIILPKSGIPDSKKKLIRTIIDEKIPFLIFSNDKHLSNEYNSLFKNMQNIDFSFSDPTTKNYQEVLNEYLHDFFSLDSQIDEIKKSFKGKIFLSYRQKDRKIAQTLIEKIHNYEEFQAVAIWYDQYIKPSEVFDQNIEKNLAESDCMIISLTPNIYNEDNWIKDHEIPLAYELEKTMVPVEMIEINREELFGFFSNCKYKFPNNIIPNSNDNLKIKLNSILGDLCKLDTDYYHLGLAYLKSIDTEKNIDVAIKMLNTAHLQDCVQASQTLANIYYYGNGVEKNVEIAESYLEYCLSNKHYEDRLQICARLMKMYYETHNSSSAKDLYDKYAINLYISYLNTDQIDTLLDFEYYYCKILLDDCTKAEVDAHRCMIKKIGKIKNNAVLKIYASVYIYDYLNKNYKEYIDICSDLFDYAYSMGYKEINDVFNPFNPLWINQKSYSDVITWIEEIDNDFFSCGERIKKLNTDIIQRYSWLFKVYSLQYSCFDYFKDANNEFLKGVNFCYDNVFAYLDINFLCLSLDYYLYNENNTIKNTLNILYDYYKIFEGYRSFLLKVTQKDDYFQSLTDKLCAHIKDYRNYVNHFDLSVDNYLSRSIKKIITITSSFLYDRILDYSDDIPVLKYAKELYELNQNKDEILIYCYVLYVYKKYDLVFEIVKKHNDILRISDNLLDDELSDDNPYLKLFLQNFFEDEIRKLTFQLILM